MNASDRVPKELDCGNLAKEWPKWKQEFVMYMRATKRMGDSECEKVAAMLWFIGERGREIFNSLYPHEGDIETLFQQPVVEEEGEIGEADAAAVAARNERIRQAEAEAAANPPLTYAAVVTKFDGYCLPRKNLAMESFKFHTIVQKEKQTFAEFETELRTQSQYCEFQCDQCKKPYAERMLRDRIIVAVQDKKLQLKLLDGKDEPLSSVIDKCKIFESAAVNKRILEKRVEKTESKVEVVENVDAVGRLRSCFNCGQAFDANHLKRCPARNIDCRGCGKKGHFQNHCRSKEKNGEASGTSTSVKKPEAPKKTVKSIDWNDIGNSHYINLSALDECPTVSNCVVNNCRINQMESGAMRQSQSWYKTFRIQNQAIKFKLDTGADVSCIPIAIVKQLPKQKQTELKQTKVVLTDYSSNKLKLHGTIQLSCFDSDLQITHNALFHVVEDAFEPLLGLPECISFGLIKRVAKVSTMPTDVGNFVAKYTDVFEGLGRIPGKCSITLKEDSVPSLRYRKRIPSTLVEPLRSQITEMVENGILSPVDYPTDWVNNLQIVEKPNGSLRICLDPKPLNKCIKREHFLIPTTEDLMSRLSGQRIFTILDCRNGFWQMELDEKSADLTTFMTPFGRYRWNRVPFGLNNAPELFQKRMVRIFGDLPGVEVYFDDIAIGGASMEEHDATLERVMERARLNNVRFNGEKVQYRKETVKFMGHIISSGHIKPDMKYIAAIKEMPRPNNKSDVMRLLGLFKYMARFIPNLSKRSANLRNLTKNNVEWIWNEEHEAEVNDLLSSISTAPVLAIFDPRKPIVVQTDSSKDGLGCVLLQDGQPVAYASRSLSKSEQRWAQIEKELLAIVFACERFHYFLYGREFVVQSDHKPLEALVKRDIDDVTMRLQRMFMQLLKYPGMTITYTPGKEMLVADCLSRAALSETDPGYKELTGMVHILTRRACLSKDNYNAYVEALAEDKRLQSIIEYVKNCWPPYRQLDESSQMFHRLKDELHFENGLLFKDHRLVVPLSLREKICKWVHLPHLGMEKTLARARERFYWPGMSQEISELVRSCSVCEQFKRNNQKEPLRQNETPEYPWQRVSMDLFEFAGRDYIAMVDAYSGLVCSEQLRNKTSGHIVSVLHRIFSQVGYPTEIRADNSPFGSREFERFANEANIVFTFSSPRYPQSNGLAEKSVAIAKNILRRCYEEDLMDEFGYRILEYNATPVASMGISPAQLFFGRQVKTKMPITDQLLHRSDIKESKVQERLECKKARQRLYYDRNAKRLPILDVGTRVIFKKNGREWHYGRIARSVNERSYIVVDDYDNHYRRNRRFIAVAHGNGFNTSEMLSEELNEQMQGSQAERPVMEAPPRVVVPNGNHANAQEDTRRPLRELTPEPQSSSESESDASFYFDAESADDSELVAEVEPAVDVPGEPVPYRTRYGRQVREPKRFGEWVRH